MLLQLKVEEMIWKGVKCKEKKETTVKQIVKKVFFGGGGNS